MGVTIHVNGMSNSLAHKGSMGIAKSTLPDVCKTPSPGGPVPVPYPVIVSMSKDLKKGTKTVKVDGKKPAAVKGSEFSRCMGDEPGTAGGVKSSTNMKEATWLLYSFDVKLDGKNACRLTDKMMMNHGNSMCLAGLSQNPVQAKKQIQTWVNECDKEVDKSWDEEHPSGPKHTNCWSDSGDTMKRKGQKVPKPVQVKLGELKEECVYDKIDKDDHVKIQQGFTKDGKPASFAGTGGGYTDIIIHTPGNIKSIQAVFDLKFPCPSGTGKQGQWSEGQFEKYKKITGVDPQLIFPI
ncbi:MAG: DUF4150 domain-containing protein [Candidatus Electrothrix sp. AR4]|nr:DUF4150 domain-containing protein [Candidatus Electrothrix sp. AR4]